MPDLKSIAKNCGVSLKDMERYYARGKKETAKRKEKGKEVRNPAAYTMAVALRSVQKTGNKPHSPCDKAIKKAKEEASSEEFLSKLDAVIEATL